GELAQPAVKAAAMEVRTRTTIDLRMEVSASPAECRRSGAAFDGSPHGDRVLSLAVFHAYGVQFVPENEQISPL
ncbi:MAG: hypothetical protein ACRELB_07430, partial [Polyangiaceae bacterium]